MTGTHNGRTHNGRPQILISTLGHEVNDRALVALAARERNLFQRAGLLVQVVQPPTGAPGNATSTALEAPPRVKLLAESRLRELLARHCAFVKLAGAQRHLKPAHPPRWTVRALLSRGTWDTVPALAGVIEGPALRTDGSVLQRRGFDAATGLLYQPNAAFDAVPSDPTSAQVQGALAALREVVVDFPFRDEAHFSAWLAGLLTPLARPAFEGPAPLFLIDANAAGAGKSLLADVCSTLLTGRPAPRMSYSNDEDEVRKQITAVALQASSIVLVDNVIGPLGSATLDRALTAESWSDRLLGGNEQVSVPLRTAWFVTGNQMVVRGDTVRRCLHIRLETRDAHPQRRTQFQHPRLLSWLRRERGRLLPAALTLLRAYAAAGSPRVELSGWGSFEGWSDVVRSTVVWLGLADPAQSRASLVTTKVGAHRCHRDLIQGVAELLDDLGGVASSKEMLEMLQRHPDSDSYPLLRSALTELSPGLEVGALPTPTQLTAELSLMRDRRIEGLRLEQESRNYKGVRWRVRRRT